MCKKSEKDLAIIVYKLYFWKNIKTMKISLNRILLLFVMLSSLGLFAQNNTPEQYIEKYKLIAIQNRFDYNIPASITLAQGLLESAYGNSKLAVEANNHFGIKCHNDWTGKRIYKDDDTKDECFRVYDNVAESYRDHALFLTGKSRYEFLFSYKITDYHAWAKGLQQAGYATNPKYPERLTDLIERYDLGQFDRMSKKDYEKLLASSGQIAVVVIPDTTVIITGGLPDNASNINIFYINRAKCVIVQPGETLVQIAIKVNSTPNRIYKYNDLAKGSVIKAGMILFIQPKRSKGDVKFHSVEKGETLWQISQKHGIKMKHLLKKNQLTEDSKIKAGDKLYLKKNKQ